MRTAQEESPGVTAAADPANGFGRTRRRDDPVANGQTLDRLFPAVSQDEGAAAVARWSVLDVEFLVGRQYHLDWLGL